MDVSIVIVNYNTLKITQDCINSIFEYSSNIEFEVILVDNASEDGSRDCFVKDHRITYVYSEENLGFGKANNLGLTFASGKYIFLLNSDTLLRNNAVKIFYDKMESLPAEIGCLGTELTDLNGNKMHSYGEFPTIPLFLKRRLLHFPYVKQKSIGFDNLQFVGDLYQVDYITGADIFIRRSVIDSYGLFDPDFFLYYEETEMQYRYRKNGIISYIYTAPRIVHLEGQSGKDVRNDLMIRIYANKSILLYVRKTNCIIDYCLFCLVYFILSIPILFYSRYKIKQRFAFLKSLIPFFG